MASEPRSLRLAVLIDADNASADIVDGLFEEIAKIGEASARRIYGDFASGRLRKWADVLARHAIVPQQQFSYTTGKNASDITLVIDAMDLLHSGRFDGFCLVSSDSDFTRLASRIREHGTDVYGFGEQKTPESFRQACRRFIYTENLVVDTAGKASGAGAAVALQPLAVATEMLRKAMDAIESEDGWVSLGAVGKQLANLNPDFDPRTYGVRKLSDLIRRTDRFEIDAPEGGSMRIRLKPVARPAMVKPPAAGRAQPASQPARPPAPSRAQPASQPARPSSQPARPSSQQARPSSQPARPSASGRAQPASQPVRSPSPGRAQPASAPEKPPSFGRTEPAAPPAKPKARPG